MEQKKYTDIVRLGHKSTEGVLNEGDYIIVWEKLDGANASFRLSKDEKSVLAFSRNTPLDESNNLRGFYQWVQENIDPDKLMPGLIYYGEWLVKHKLDYGDNGGQQFYLFDIYNEGFDWGDELTGEYVGLSWLVGEAEVLKVQLAPILYAGKYKSFDHLMSFVGKSALGAQGEGIVVKNVSYKNRFGHQVFVKLVSEAFAEIQPQKPPRDPNAPESLEAVFIKTFMTPARVEKLLFKLVDEGIIDAEFGLEDMGTILRNLGNCVYDDILKEETPPDGFEEKDARRTVGKFLPIIVKQIINDRN